MSVCMHIGPCGPGCGTGVAPLTFEGNGIYPQVGKAGWSPDFESESVTGLSGPWLKAAIRQGLVEDPHTKALERIADALERIAENTCQGAGQPAADTGSAAGEAVNAAGGPAPCLSPSSAGAAPHSPVWRKAPGNSVSTRRAREILNDLELPGIHPSDVLTKLQLQEVIAELLSWRGWWRDFQASREERGA